MKKNLILVVILLLVGTLVACSAAQSTTSGVAANRPSGSGSASQTKGTSTASELPLESKVGIGILQLEGTDQAVDEAKAKELLPLFKALKTLSTNNNTAVDEITALNKQIKNTMTADQLTAIEKMSLTTAEIRTLMEKNGLLSANSASSSGSNSSSQGGFGGPGGPPDAAMMAAMGGSGSTSSKTRATPNAAAAMNTSRKTAGGYNLTFAEPIIKLLESKITK